MPAQQVAPVTARSGRAPNARSALVVIDVQVDFLPGGALAVPHGDEVVPIANYLAQSFDNVVLTQDWHPAGHISFASSHPGRVAHETISLPYGEQILWPDHCIQDSVGARLASRLDIPHAQLIVRKGHHSNIDSYSAFYEADRATPTGLAGYLRDRSIDTVYVMGLATDFCVSWSAVDAARHGFATHVIEDGCRGLDLNGSLARAWADMTAAGVHRVTLDEFAA
ncbi:MULTISPECIES: bifunctional nicotinamidase/pyrazinamidase [unclassified Xanthobacter]|uniref:bifunctional nicotinamidase/pyrazinamidase n=1 Tax=unclassified Xanthobacter TaxID=2623496 RepID=UPI001EE01A43|nr:MULTISPECIES: bifunctional nicotinamidase/pyrazinamidase [unclassified Xanthobacter]